MNAMQQFFKAAPNLRPLVNLFSLFDITTGKWVKGYDSNWYLNGGLSYLTGVAGRGNSFKSVLSVTMAGLVKEHLRKSFIQAHDSEASVQLSRFEQLYQNLQWLGQQDLYELNAIFLSDNTVMSGNEWFAGLRKWVEERVKSRKELLATTPFLDPATGEQIKIIYPSVSLLDSISMLQTDSVDAIYDKNQIGESGANTDSLRGSAAKSQMLMQIPTLTGKGEIRSIMSAHMGDDIPLDPYAPNVKKLGFLKGKDKLKHTPEKFTFLTNNLWQVLSCTVFANKDKTPMFPRSREDDLEGDTDLQILTLRNLRAKSGPTGMTFQLIVSQQEGLLIPLSEFFYCKTYDGYGIGGHDRAYFFDLLPDVNMQRTTVRSVLNSDPRAAKAASWTALMCAMENLQTMPEDLKCTPRELYNDIKALGYDWERLYDTREYWTMVEEESEHKPVLTLYNLLLMRKGEFHPKWYGDLPKK